MARIRIQIRDQRYEADLPWQVLSVGSAEGCGLRLASDSLAAEHFSLEPLPGGGLLVRDSQSGLETRVNGYVVKQVTLDVGDVIEAGELRVELLDAAPPPPEAVPEAGAAAAAAPARATSARPAPGPSPGGTPAGPAAPGPTPARGAGPARGDAPRPAAPGDSRRATPRRRLVPLLVVGLALLGALVVLLQITQPQTGDVERLDRLLRDADSAREAREFSAARVRYEELVKAGGRHAEAATRGLERLAATEFELGSELERLWAERMDLSSADFDRRRQRFVERFGSESEPRFAQLRERVVAAQSEWRDAALEALKKEIDAYSGAGRFAAAMDACERLRKIAPLGVDLSAAFADYAEQLEDAAQRAAHTLRAEVDALLADGRPDLAAGRLERALPGYAGLSPHPELMARLEQARTASAAAPPPVPSSTPQVAHPGAGPEPGTEPTPPVAPRTAPDAERLEALRAEIAPLLAERRYAQAAARLREACADLPEGDTKALLQGQAQDLADAGLGLAALVDDINQHASRYARIEVRPRLMVALSSASEDSLEARVSGGSMRYPWKHVPSATLGTLAERSQARGMFAFQLAVLLHVAGETESAREWLFIAGSSGADTATVFERLARWRGDGLPADGYVEFERRYVTVQEREHLLREARIAKAIERINAKESKERAAALSELLEIGEPARARAREALLRRRTYLEGELAQGKGYSASRHRGRLLTLLEERRKHALALIYDAQAYPYPNPNKQSQVEVETRVDAVRQVWERAFELVSQWDGDLQAGLALLTEADEALVQVDPAWRPDLATLSKRVSAAIDVPGAADGDLRAYSLKVLGYNETLPTTATEQEKDNVRIVNEYRMMMGLQAVKIEERLTRAARGHSRHMRENGYFAHDVPADKGANAENRTPGARAQRQGYGGGVGENIARGPSTGRGAFWAWFGSSGHHRNMLGRGWHEMGCGRSGQSWWTQLFGGGSKSVKMPDALPDPDPFYAPEKEPAGSGGGGPVEVPDEVPPGEPPPPVTPGTDPEAGS